MADIGMRDLKTRASQIVREVKEQRKRYTITRRGRPVALLVPLEEPGALQAPEKSATAWDDLVRLGEEIGEGWQASESSTELLSEMRR